MLNAESTVVMMNLNMVLRGEWQKYEYLGFTNFMERGKLSETKK
jgi:hypothetical protein